jgi:hypothetical protein
MKVSFILFPSCFYCNETCFSKDGVVYPDNSCDIINISSKFCSPECVCAYNKYILRGVSHSVLEIYYGRRVWCAPERRFLHHFSLRGGMMRVEWLNKCREGLTPAEREVSPKTSVEKDLRIVKK